MAISYFETTSLSFSTSKFLKINIFSMKLFFNEAHCSTNTGAKKVIHAYAIPFVFYSFFPFARSFNLFFN